MIENSLVLKEILLGVKLTLREHGFRAKGLSFHQQAPDGNTMVVSIQKSMRSTRAETLLAMNFGVYSKRLGISLEESPTLATGITNAHWRKRLPNLSSTEWLLVDYSKPSGHWSGVLSDAAESVIPDLLAHSTDVALRDEWLAGSSPGLTEMQRLLFAAILVSLIGPTERLREVVGELRALVAGHVQERYIENELMRSGIRIPV